MPKNEKGDLSETDVNEISNIPEIENDPVVEDEENISDLLWNTQSKANK